MQEEFTPSSSSHGQSKVCAHCGVRFDTKDKRQKYCSRACYQQWWIANKQRDAAARGFERIVGMQAGLPTVLHTSRAPEPYIEDDDADDLEWAERGEYWGAVADAPTRQRAARRGAHRAQPLVLTGHGVQLRVDHGALLVRDGFTHYPQRRREVRLFPNDRTMPSRIVILDGDGSITFDVVAWLAEQHVPLVVLNWRGEVVSVLGGDGVAPDASVRAAQIAAQTNGIGDTLAAQLIRDKVAESKITLNTLPMSPHRANALQIHDDVLAALATKPQTIESIRLEEARAAAAYFKCWQGIPLRWKGTGQHPIPREWQWIGARSAFHAKETNRHATHPVNAVLNYAYGVLESQVRIATMAAGLDPTIGYLHACRPGRLALVYDLMEPIRPTADRMVLNFIRSQTFAPKDFMLTNAGGCRLHPRLVRLVISHSAGWGTEHQLMRDISVTTMVTKTIS